MHVDVGKGKVAGAVVVTLLGVVVLGDAVVAVVVLAVVFDDEVVVVVMGSVVVVVVVVVVRQLQALEMRWRGGISRIGWGEIGWRVDLRMSRKWRFRLALFWCWGCGEPM